MPHKFKCVYINEGEKDVKNTDIASEFWYDKISSY